MHFEWQALLDAMAAVPGDALLTPGVVEDWSVRDLMVHVTSWDGELLKALPTILEGRRPPRYSTTYGGIDAFNALVQGRSSELPLVQVRREMAAMHGRVLAALQAAPESEFAVENRLRRRIREDSYSHYRQHATHIRQWLDAFRPTAS
jgi:hypothetical protein